MNKTKYFSILLLLMSFFTFTSCDIEPLDPAINLDDFNPNPGSPIFKADFSGQTFVASNTQVVISGNTIAIQATRGSFGEGFGLIINGNSTGTYQANQNILTFTPANSNFGYWSINPENATANTGSVTITSINTVNKTISGIFNFTGYWSNTSVNNILPVQFTNGVFQNLPYITQTSNNDFFAKVNGVEFVDTNIQTNVVSAGSNQLINITASNSNNDAISLNIDNSLNAGTYQISSGQVQGFYKLNNTVTPATTGTVTVISKSSTRIKGTFQLNVTSGANTYQITEGTFDVGY